MSENQPATPFIPAWFDDAGLSSSAFRVACHLWRRADLKAGRPWTCYPSAKTIAQTCRMKRDTVFAALGELERRGLLAREQKAGGSNTYTLTLVGSPEKGDDSQSGTSRKGGHQPSPQTGREVVPKGGTQRFPIEGSPKKVDQQPSAAATLALPGMEIARASHSPAGPAPKPILQLRAEKLMRRREGTPMSPKEQKAWKAALPAIEATTEDEWRFLEAFYARPRPSPPLETTTPSPPCSPAQWPSKIVTAFACG